MLLQDKQLVNKYSLLAVHLLTNNKRYDDNKDQFTKNRQEKSIAKPPTIITIINHLQQLITKLLSQIGSYLQQNSLFPSENFTAHTSYLNQQPVSTKNKIKIIKTLLEEFWTKDQVKKGERKKPFIQRIKNLVVKMIQTSRNFREEDIPAITEKLFQSFDDDKNQRFTKSQFPKVMKSLTNLIGGDQPHLEDIQDLFNLLDINGDQRIDRSEFKSLIQTFFKVLVQKRIDLRISKQTDICI